VGGRVKPGHDDGLRRIRSDGQDSQKFFGSFFQKRTSFFLRINGTSACVSRRSRRVTYDWNDFDGRGGDPARRRGQPAAGQAQQGQNRKNPPGQLAGITVMGVAR
jgi:hypothetical protein